MNLSQVREFIKVREINCKLPFAHPIQRGEETTFAEFYGTEGAWYQDHPALTDIPELNPLNG